MPALLRHTLLLAALTAATWLAVIALWYQQQREVSLQDVLLYLLALPLLLFAGGFIARRALRGPGAAPAAAASPAAPVRAGTGAAPAGWAVRGAWVHCAAGTDLEALVATPAPELPHPAPDPQLCDLDGLPVLSARIASLDTAAVQAALPADTPVADAALRALAALSPLLEQACEAHAPAAPDGDVPPAPSRPALHVLAHWPPGWSAAEAEAAHAWLAQRLQALAPGVPVAWPAAPAERADSGAALLQQAQTQLATLQAEGRGGRLLLLACHSDLDDDGVLRLERAGRLYAMPRCRDGKQPGEAAAALLLEPPGRPVNADTDDGQGDGAAVRVLWQAEQRPGGAPVSRRPDAATLQALLGQALEAAGLEAAAVASVSADAAQHTGAGAEVHALAQATLAQLDPVDGLQLLGTPCGHVGGVAPLLALAAAWAQCRREGQAALAVSATEGEWRVVGLAVKAHTDTP